MRKTILYIACLCVRHGVRAVRARPEDAAGGGAAAGGAGGGHVRRRRQRLRRAQGRARRHLALGGRRLR